MSEIRLVVLNLQKIFLVKFEGTLNRLKIWIIRILKVQMKWVQSVHRRLNFWFQKTEAFVVFYKDGIDLEISPSFTKTKEMILIVITRRRDEPISKWKVVSRRRCDKRGKRACTHKQKGERPCTHWQNESDIKANSSRREKSVQFQKREKQRPKHELLKITKPIFNPQNRYLQKRSNFPADFKR